MADVYKAIDEVLGRTVAVKVMHARFATDETFVARFRQEAQAAANLSSPNIVNMYDWGQDGPDTYYIVMEYVLGSDLKSIIGEKGALPSRTVAEIGAQVCAALSVAHGYDVIHRDIKPHNVMVQPDGTVKVMDFGIARAGNSNLTQTGSVFGTAHYLSPEQAQGQSLTPASDLYSLGVLLYEAATGRLPFDGDTPVAVALKQVNEEAVAPRAVNAAVDPGLDAVIVKAMRKGISDRYSSARDLRADLQAVAQGRPVGVAVLGAVAGAAAAASAGVPSRRGETAVMPAVSSSGPTRSVTRPRARAVQRRGSALPWIAASVVALAALGVALGLGLLGSRSATVPNVVSTTRSEAGATLKSAGFTQGGITEAFSTTVRVGAVVSQSPKSGTAAEDGAVVDLVLSKGLQTVRVPNVVGLLETDAFKALQKAGFSPQALPSQFNQDVPALAVYGQDPVGATKAVKGSVVNYLVSRGPEPVVPQLRGNRDKPRKWNDDRDD